MYCNHTAACGAVPERHSIQYVQKRPPPLNGPAKPCHLSQQVLRLRQACLSHSTVMLTTQHGWPQWQVANQRTASQQSSAPACSSCFPFLSLHQTLQQALSWLPAASKAGSSFIRPRLPPGTTLCLVFCMATVRDDAICSVSLQLHEAEAGQGTAPGPWIPDA